MKTKVLFQSIFTIVMIFGVGSLVYALISMNAISYVSKVDNNTQLVHFNSGNVRLRATSSQQYISEKFEQIIFTDDDTLAVFIDDGLRGYISTRTGKVIIPAKYTHAWMFSEGRACVTDFANYLGVIDRNGNTIVRFKYRYSPTNDNNMTCEVDYLFHEGKCLVTDSIYVGLIDTSGHELLHPIYQDLIFENLGYTSVKKDDLWGLYDSSYNKVLNNDFIDLNVTPQGILVEDEESTLLSFDGKEVLSSMVLSDCEPLLFIESSDLNYFEEDEFEETHKISVDSVCKGFTVISKGMLAGLMRNSDQKIIIPCMYHDIKAITNKLFRCQLPDTESFILMNQNGVIVK